MNKIDDVIVVDCLQELFSTIFSLKEGELISFRSSRSQMFFIGVLKGVAIFTGKHLCWSLFSIKKLQHSCFPVNIVKF